MWRRRLKRRRNLRQNSRTMSLSHLNQYITLMQWMKKNGFSCRNCHLKPAEFPDTGRGLMARKTLLPGDTLIEIPGSLLITAEKVLQTELGEVIKRQHYKPTPEQVISIFLVAERAKGPASFWHPYIDVLPKSFDAPVCCTAKHSDFDILPEPARSKAGAQLDNVALAFRDAAPLFEAVERAFPECHGLFDYESFLWAWFVANSRCVYVQQRKCEALKAGATNDFALAPFLDLLNHSPAAKDTAGFSCTEGKYQIKTLEKYTIHDQVFICYGPHDNTSLLLEYGFVIPGNPHDAVVFDFELILDASVWAGTAEGRAEESCSRFSPSMLEKKKDLLLMENLCGNLCCARSRLSWRLTAALRTLCMDFQELKSWKRRISGVGSVVLTSATQQLVNAAFFKLTDDSIADAHENLKRLSDSSFQSNGFLPLAKLMWQERIDVLTEAKATAQI